MTNGIVEKADENEFPENRRTVYDDAGEWSRHYSTVRMTVATFVITTCVAIIALTGDQESVSRRVGDSVCLLWLLGLAIFYAFTRLTFKERNRQLNHRIKMPLAANEAGIADKEGAKILGDAASWALLIINTLFAASTFLPGQIETSLPTPVLRCVLFLASLGILLFIISSDSSIEG
jgi:hypothetical protein